MRCKKYFPLLNFFVGMIFLVIVLWHTLSLSIGKSLLLFAVILSFFYTYTLAHIFWRGLDKGQEELEFLKSRGLRYLIFFMGSFGFGVLLFGLMYPAFAKPGTSFSSIVKVLGLLFTTGTFLMFLASLFHKGDKTPEKIIYSWRNFLRELSVFFLLFTVAYFSGVGLEWSVSMALYVFVVAGWYYSMMAHRYIIPGSILKIRVIINFVAVSSGLYLFVIKNALISVLMGVLFAFASEKDYKITKKLVETGLLERRYAESGVSSLFYALFYLFGAIGALALITRSYDLSFIRESLLTVFRLLYLFTAVFLPFGTLLGWMRLRVHGE